MRDCNPQFEAPRWVRVLLILLVRLDTIGHQGLLPVGRVALDPSMDAGSCIRPLAIALSLIQTQTSRQRFCTSSSTSCIVALLYHAFPCSGFRMPDRYNRLRHVPRMSGGFRRPPTVCRGACTPTLPGNETNICFRFSVLFRSSQSLGSVVTRVL